MSSITKETVEQTICTPIINYVHDGRGMSETTLSNIIRTARALVAERDALLATTKGTSE